MTPAIDAPSLTYSIAKYNNVNMVFNTTKMAKATNVLYKMVWKARKDGQLEWNPDLVLLWTNLSNDWADITSLPNLIE